MSSVSDLVGTWLGPAAAAVDALQDGTVHDWALICAADRTGRHGHAHAHKQRREYRSRSAARPGRRHRRRHRRRSRRRTGTAVVADFPAALVDRRRSGCPALLQAGHAVYTRFGGHRPDQVLDALREFVRAGMEG